MITPGASLLRHGFHALHGRAHGVGALQGDRSNPQAPALPRSLSLSLSLARALPPSNAALTLRRCPTGARAALSHGGATARYCERLRRRALRPPAAHSAVDTHRASITPVSRVVLAAQVVKHYLRTWFPIDLISVVPANYIPYIVRPRHPNASAPAPPRRTILLKSSSQLTEVLPRFYPLYLHPPPAIAPLHRAPPAPQRLRPRPAPETVARAASA
eukprot:COSAG01_NODE_1441_length_10293_cov_4.232392_15_plen_216_part_00